ncbi:MAG: DUF1330 domain-containing protein [Bacteroidota bacterium]
MIYITQLVYVKPGKEAVFEEFEAVAIPAIARYNGVLMLRLRPGADTVIEAGIAPPYEVHLVSFESEEDFERFKADETRKQFLHLKEESVSAMLLIKGTGL